MVESILVKLHFSLEKCFSSLTHFLSLEHFKIGNCNFTNNKPQSTRIFVIEIFIDVRIHKLWIEKLLKIKESFKGTVCNSRFQFIKNLFYHRLVKKDIPKMQIVVDLKRTPSPRM